MWVKKRHKIIVAILKPVFKLYTKLKYNCIFDKPVDCKEGSVIISNHTTTMDPFLVGMLFKQNLYYMASADLFQHKITGKIITFLVNPIPKEKSNSSDISAIKNCVRVAKENGNICIFVEGNRTLSGKLGNIDYSIVKLLKLIKKPLYICNIQGGYPTDPRWGNSIRRGKMKVGIKQVIPYEELKDMDNDELYKLIVEQLTVDDYNFYPQYKGNRRAEHLERILYICPVCKKLHTISTNKNHITCSSCGLTIEHLPNLTFKANNEKFNLKNVAEWYDYQIDEIKKSEYKDNELIYQDNANFFITRAYKSKLKLGEGIIKLYNNRFEFITKDNTININFDNIKAVTLVGKKKMNIYANDNTYQIRRDLKFNALKYMHMYCLIKNQKDGEGNDFLGL